MFWLPFRIVLYCLLFLLYVPLLHFLYLHFSYLHAAVTHPIFFTIDPLFGFYDALLFYFRVPTQISALSLKVAP